ncbi:23S rRNA 5-methyluridine methyltransferase [Xanthomonas fragariae]|uniref:23S rRNA (uracil(1939)-C(5))-methyltransferase RlmD n=1 Tax=Xanthomonas fragariae TaxID=48664 RepID=A0A1Y6HHC9_9XANT|nr:23S rRNA 5-methyluridine methyltransferase [Xanthomonas fragariae]SMR02767.1 23S rRNA 5-methyluridine methyltransferase [Xanthomonas fragariae]
MLISRAHAEFACVCGAQQLLRRLGGGLGRSHLRHYAPFLLAACRHVARTRNRFDRTPFQTAITDLSHDGRGVARRDGEGGKVTFISGALPGELVRAEPTAHSRHFDEARTVEVLEASPQRVTPRCPHFGVCAGCVLQHLEELQQILSKQRVLMDNLERIGHVTPQTVLPALVGDNWGYRRKGRFSVRRVEKKDKTLVGFRELDPRFVADLSVCYTVIPQIGEKIPLLAALVEGMDGKRDIPQIEFIAGDAAVVLTVRHMQPLSERDRQALTEFAQAQGFAIFLQPGGVDSVHPLWPHDVPLSFRLPQWDVELAFRPLDFIQVNASLNQKMIAHALTLLDAKPDDRVLDLFCGLGNFTLPLARGVREVVGVEGDAGLVARAKENAQRNGLDNAQFYAADLTQDQRNAAWMRQGFDKLLLDPPRSGALEVLQQLPLKKFERIVYVSCHPGSLARDAGYLVNAQGFTLKAAGAMDMFPHTAHVESIAVFERR